MSENWNDTFRLARAIQEIPEFYNKYYWDEYTQWFWVLFGEHLVCFMYLYMNKQMNGKYPKNLPKSALFPVTTTRPPLHDGWSCLFKSPASFHNQVLLERTFSLFSHPLNSVLSSISSECLYRDVSKLPFIASVVLNQRRDMFIVYKCVALRR